LLVLLVTISGFLWLRVRAYLERRETFEWVESLEMVIMLLSKRAVSPERLALQDFSVLRNDVALISRVVSAHWLAKAAYARGDYRKVLEVAKPVFLLEEVDEIVELALSMV
jgi:uncharacterized membrane protein